MGLIAIGDHLGGVDIGVLHGVVTPQDHAFPRAPADVVDPAAMRHGGDPGTRFVHRGGVRGLQQAQQGVVDGVLGFLRGRARGLAAPHRRAAHDLESFPLPGSH